MKRILVTALFVVAESTLLTSQLSAQETSFTAGLSVGPAALKSEIAKVEGIGDSPWLVQLDGSMTLDGRFRFSTGFGLGLFSDNAEFTESTTGGTKTSTITGFHLCLQAGLVQSLEFGGDPKEMTFDKAEFGLSIGYNFLGAHRGIDNCVDCSSQDINITAGPYIQPSVILSVGSGIGLGFAYNRYLGGSDFTSQFIFSLVVTLGQ